MLRPIPPDNPTADGSVLLVGAVFFAVCGLFAKHIAGFSMRTTQYSDDTRSASVKLMRPILFLFAAAAALFAFMLLTGRC